MAKKVARFGEWASPIGTDRITAESVRLEAVAVDGDRICWREGRPAEGGRYALVCRELDGASGTSSPRPSTCAAERMVQVLRERGLPVAYLAFEGEQHGFRRAETIEATLQAELCFYGRVFGFGPDGDLPPLEIENL